MFRQAEITRRWRSKAVCRTATQSGIHMPESAATRWNPLAVVRTRRADVGRQEEWPGMNIVPRGGIGATDRDTAKIGRVLVTAERATGFIGGRQQVGAQAATCRTPRRCTTKPQRTETCAMMRISAREILRTADRVRGMGRPPGSSLRSNIRARLRRACRLKRFSPDRIHRHRRTENPGMPNMFGMIPNEPIYITNYRFPLFCINELCST